MNIKGSNSWFFSIDRIGGIVLAIGLIAFCAHASMLIDYTMDDAFITFRYARNFAAGYGLFFNAADSTRSEGITSPLYGLILAALSFSGVSLKTCAKCFGLAAALGATAIIYNLVLKLNLALSNNNKKQSLFMAFAAAALLLADQFIAGNSVSGMETAAALLAFSGFLLLLWHVQHEEVSIKKLLACGIAATLVPMWRPEMAAAVISMIGFLIVLHPKNLKQNAAVASTFVFLGFIYFYARYSYYGLLLPLPFYIKQAGLSFYGLKPFIQYAFHAFVLIGLALVSGCSSLALRKRKENPTAVSFLLALATCCIIQFSYYLTVRHIMGFGHRYFIPISAGLIVVAFASLPCALALIPIDAKSHFTRLLCFILIILILATALGIDDAKSVYIKNYAIGEARAERIGQLMHRLAAGEDFSIAMNDCGAIPFYTNFKTIDLAGLNNKAIALDRSDSSITNELANNSPDIVFLVSRGETPKSIYDWERGKNVNMTSLGYSLVTSIYIGKDYYYLLYSKDDSRARQYIQSIKSMI